MAASENSAFIQSLLEKAGAELSKRFGQDNNVRDKADSSLVTDADLASEAIILDQIGRQFPSDAVISEESGYRNVKRSPGEYVWIVDPLDGTTNFANGYPFFSVSIARAVFSDDLSIEIIEGGIIDPMRNQTYLASKGGGATLNGTPLRVRESRPLPKCFLVTGFYYTRGEALDFEIDRFHKVAQSCQSIRRDGSAALDLALTAAGVYDAFWERGLGLWDVAAGSLLVSEAGGRISNYPQAKTSSLDSPEGPLSYNLEGDGIIAGSPKVAAEIFSLLT